MSLATKLETLGLISKINADALPQAQSFDNLSPSLKTKTRGDNLKTVYQTPVRYSTAWNKDGSVDEPTERFSRESENAVEVKNNRMN